MHKVLADQFEVASCESASSGNDGRHVAEVKLLIMLQLYNDKHYIEFNSLLTLCVLKRHHTRKKTEHMGKGEEDKLLKRED